MEKERLIISLIQQDLKHNQLLSGLEKLGLSGSDVHCLTIFDIVSRLMNVPESIEEDWGDLYVSYMHQAIQYRTTSTGEYLKPLAEVCYIQLKQLVDDKYNTSNIMLNRKAR